MCSRSSTRGDRDPISFLPLPIVNETAEAGLRGTSETGPIKHSFGLAAFEIEQPVGFLDPGILLFAMDGRQLNSGVELTVFGEPTPGIRRLLGGVQVQAQNSTSVGNVAVSLPDVQLNLHGEVDLPPPFLSGLTLTGRVIHTSAQFYDLTDTRSIPDRATLDIGLR